MNPRHLKLKEIIEVAIWKSRLVYYMERIDAVQDIWIKILEKFPVFRDPPVFSDPPDEVSEAQLYWFSYRRAQDLKRWHVRRGAAEVAVEPSSLSERIAELGEEPEPTPEMHAAANEILAIAGCVLTTRQKAVIHGLHVEGKSQEQVGKENDISSSRVQQIESKALEAIRKRVNDDAPSPSSPRKRVNDDAPPSSPFRKRLDDDAPPPSSAPPSSSFP